MGLQSETSNRKRADLELFLDVLGATATKREAKSYLSRFRSEKPKSFKARLPEARQEDVGVNLGNLYLPVRAVDQSPVFTQGPGKTQLIGGASTPLHSALVKIREPQAIEDSALRGVCLTLVQLNRLGMSSVVVVDCEDRKQRTDYDLRRLAMEQADRVTAAIDALGGPGARRLDNVLGSSHRDEGLRFSVKILSGTHIINRNLILTPLRKGKVPVIAPIAFTSADQTLTHIPADEAVLALTKDLAGLGLEVISEANVQEVAEKIQARQKEISLDRIILLDRLGGIPSLHRQHQSHVFINLEQEYDDIKSELSSLSLGNAKMHDVEESPTRRDVAFRSFASSNTISKFWDDQSSFMSMQRDAETHEVNNHPVAGNASSTPMSKSWDSQSGFRKEAKSTESGTPMADNGLSTSGGIHLSNLALLRDTLAILPPSSSGLLTTPENAANANQAPQDSTSAPGVGTRRQRNPLIHNLLTDKPVFSSSLPSERTQQSTNPSGQKLPVIPATFVKRGMPVTMIPDPRIHPWRPPTPFNPPSIQLSDSRFDLPRLIHLIEDSFGRKLDVSHYLSRIENRIAGIIIAGEYEGGAILTWESPSQALSHLAATTRNFGSQAHDHQSVPYLDKFAVLKRSQGIGGVADIVFTAMVRSCLPNGVCWRSRRDNPVNKWYFERARGTWKLPDSNWTMFWTTEAVHKGTSSRFEDYEAVCRGVVPSWADDKGVVD
ncbi:MAG: hypothetical protein Q9181_003192 [Wetmoreana brouardii]